MIERVIEERANGDPAAADELRGPVLDIVGGAISGRSDRQRPGHAP
jgi:fumarylacetoacetate (FAA) hydrolase family protein